MGPLTPTYLSSITLEELGALLADTKTGIEGGYK